jgi:molybdopterin-containing oxidoreductase family iron-sulfur binding subunit
MKPDSTDTAANATGPQPRMWRGLDELAGAPGYEEATLDEFPEGASEFTDETSRRHFLKLMGASLALAGAAGCNLRPAAQRKIVPYSTQPDEITPGVPTFYASAAPLAGYGVGVLVRSNEGRPTKVEGNPDHPSSLGGASIHALASILDLYDPDRSRSVTHRGTPSSYELAIAALRSKLYNETVPNAGVRLRILTETITSPTLAAQLTQLLSLFPAARWVRFDAVGGENAREGIARAFGRPASVHYDFLKADVIVALDADFLGCGPGQVRYNRDFADRRKIRHNGKNAAELAAGRQPQPKKDKEEGKQGPTFKEGVQPDQVNRLYVAEVMPSITGSVADHRLALTSAQAESFVRALATAVGVQGVPAAGELPKEAQDWVAPVAADLLAKKGKCAVVPGEHLSPSAQAAVHAMNAALGNIGQTVHVTAPIEASVPDRMDDLTKLVSDLNAKAVDVLLVLGGANPAYSAPAYVDFAGSLQKLADEKAQLLRKGSSLTPDE